MKTLKIEIPKGYQVDEEKSTFTNIVFKPIEKKWVDLGLPSGTLWCDTNEKGYYSWDEMLEKFNEENLPKLTDFAELYDYCDWIWDDEKKGMWITGPNTNGIFLPALGFYGSELHDFHNQGLYWTTTVNGFSSCSLEFFKNNCVILGPTCRDNKLSIRCIKRTK